MANQPIPSREATTTIPIASLRPVASVSASLDALSQEEREVIQQLPDGSAMLIVLSGPGIGARFLLNIGATTLGRDPASDIFLDDITVSRKHAVIEHEIGTSYHVKDLGSLNGTYLNHESILQSDLSSGDEIHIGKFRLTFFLKEGSR